MTNSYWMLNPAVRPSSVRAPLAPDTLSQRAAARMGSVVRREPFGPLIRLFHLEAPFVPRASGEPDARTQSESQPPAWRAGRCGAPLQSCLAPGRGRGGVAVPGARRLRGRLVGGLARGGGRPLVAFLPGSLAW